MVVLKTAPFKHDTDDLLSYVTSLQLCLTFLAALVLQMDVGTSEFDSEAIGWILISINVICLLLMIISLTIALAPLCKSLCCKKKEAETKDGKPGDEEEDDDVDGGMEGF